MSAPIRIDRDQIAAIASKCQTSGTTIQEQAHLMKQYMDELQTALAGIPRLSMSDRFAEWNSQFASLSNSLEESNKYLNGVVQTVDNFVAQLGS